SSSAKRPAEQVVKDIRRATRRHFSAEDKIRIVLEGLRGDEVGFLQRLVDVFGKAAAGAEVLVPPNLMSG
ncbi:hypothetical protein, partial [Sphingomonas sp.]|uniref:hypothetical protein n=1 Tax=Sphingomonas sp. TaxID=28214 RepID=UPI0025D0935D